MAEPDDKKPSPQNPRRGGIPIGDCVLNFTTDTSNMDKSVNEIIERFERALAAFKVEWNKK